ncbi:sulfite exporter TauE/SafE family protein [Neorickettsia sennetsu]|nr:sulfite exporter TauE/SafE family protein [Neorickettsia sennetsu]
MAQIYFPIAEVAIPIYAVIALGLISGIMAGLFGIGGNIIIIPTLIFMGVAPAVAVSSAVNQTIASGFASFLNQFKQGNTDLPIALSLSLGGLFGITLGSFLLMYLRNKGNVDITIFLVYVVMLSITGCVMAFDSIRKLLCLFRNEVEPHEHMEKPYKNKLIKLINRLPLRYHFHSAKGDISLVALALFGTVVGVILSISGVGGGFILVPVLMYVFNLPVRIAIGTSVAQSVLVSVATVFFHAITLGTVDMLLGFLLSIGAICGVTFGAKLNLIFHPVVIRLLLALVMFGGVLRLLFTLLVTPESPYSFSAV